MNPVIKEYERRIKEFDEACVAWNARIKAEKDTSDLIEPEEINDEDFCDEMKEKGARLKDLIDWAVNCVDGDYAYCLDLVRYIIR